MNKKAVSPLIATVLIIGFTVALSAIVMTWGGVFMREEVEESEEDIVELCVEWEFPEECYGFEFGIPYNKCCEIWIIDKRPKEDVILYKYSLEEIDEWCNQGYSILTTSCYRNNWTYPFFCAEFNESARCVKRI